MAEGNNREKEFVDHLDLIFTNEGVLSGQAGDAEFRKTLDFAQKMKSLRIEPSAAFSANLRQRLLDRMEEQTIPNRKLSTWKSLLTQFENTFPSTLRPFALPVTALIVVFIIATVIVKPVWFANGPFFRRTHHIPGGSERGTAV